MLVHKCIYNAKNIPNLLKKIGKLKFKKIKIELLVIFNIIYTYI